MDPDSAPHLPETFPKPGPDQEPLPGLRHAPQDAGALRDAFAALLAPGRCPDCGEPLGMGRACAGACGWAEAAGGPA